MFNSTAAVRRQRLGSGLLAAALQAVLILVLLYGLAAPTIRARMQSALTSLDLRAPPAPAPPPQPARHAARRAAKAAPPARRAQAAPVVAPRVVVLTPPPPIPAAPIAAQGVATHAGAAAAGIGSGAGGRGIGTGAGGSGDGGSGDGDGDGDGAELVSGRIKSSDTPANLFHAPFSGTTSALVLIDATGAMTACQTRSSSGNAALDALTCHLIATRFHFRPARDAAGRAVPGRIIYDQDWEIGGAFDPTP